MSDAAGNQPLDGTLAALLDVAHAAWHLMDDSGESPDVPGLHEHSARDAERLSDALDALEATGWNPHPEDNDQ